MFESFIDENKTSEEVILDFASCAKPKIDIIIKELQGKTSDQIYDYIKFNLGYFLDSFKDVYDANVILSVLNCETLIALANVLAVSSITDIQRTICNRLVYDCLTYLDDDIPNDEEKKKHSQLLFIIAKKANKTIPGLLMGANIPEKYAHKLALARYSSYDERVNIKRLNFELMRMPNEFITTDSLIYIYSKLFERMTTLFEQTMFDVVIGNEDWVTEEMMDNYSFIGLSMLYILNNMMTYDELKKVLSSYTADYNSFLKSRQDIRFSLKSINGEFERIHSAILNLESEGIFVP